MGLVSLLAGTSFDEQMPTEWEQDVADRYVNDRLLVRPDTNIAKAILSVLLFLLTIGVLVLCFYNCRYLFPSDVQNFCDEHPVLLFAIVFFVGLLFCFKYAVIGAIKLYQYYAPEEIRRRCLFMPTCSEYAILAIRKYGGVIGLCKTYFRLVYLCRGNIYRINYP